MNEDLPLATRAFAVAMASPTPHGPREFKLVIYAAQHPTYLDARRTPAWVNWATHKSQLLLPRRRHEMTDEEREANELCDKYIAEAKALSPEDLESAITTMIKEITECLPPSP